MISETRLDLERDIIGQICWNSNAVFVASNYLTAGNFRFPQFRHLWKIALSIAQDFEPVDLATLKHRITDTNLIKDGFFMSRLDLILLIERAADPRINRVENLPFHCLRLVELGIREYLYNETLRVKLKHAAAVQDFRDFQAHLQLEKGYNDLFTLLEKGQIYFAPYLPDLTKRIAAAMHLIEQKASKIRSKHGKEMILKTLEYYECHSTNF